MIRETKISRPEPIIIDLDGPQGNVFVLMGIVKKLSKAGLPDITGEMMNGDYYDALWLLEKTYGDYIVLETKNATILEYFESRERLESNRLVEKIAPIYSF